MCPKAKSDQVITHRIELQQTERDAFEMLAASMAAKNVSHSINNLITPFTQASIAGITFALSIAGVVGVLSEGAKNGIIGGDGSLIEAEDIPPFFFGLIPGTVAYAIRNLSWDDVQKSFDDRMRNYSPPTM